MKNYAEYIKENIQKLNKSKFKVGDRVESKYFGYNGTVLVVGDKNITVQWDNGYTYDVVEKNLIPINNKPVVNRNQVVCIPSGEVIEMEEKMIKHASEYLGNIRFSEEYNTWVIPDSMKNFILNFDNIY